MGALILPRVLSSGGITQLVACLRTYYSIQSIDKTTVLGSLDPTVFIISINECFRSSAIIPVTVAILEQLLYPRPTVNDARKVSLLLPAVEKSAVFCTVRPRFESLLFLQDIFYAFIKVSSVYLPLCSFLPSLLWNHEISSMKPKCDRFHNFPLTSSWSHNAVRQCESFLRAPCFVQTHSLCTISFS